MAYCTEAEIIALVGTDTSASTITEIIAQADREIDARLAIVGLSGDGGNACKGASINFAVAGVLTRRRMDGSKPGSLNLGGMSMSDNIDVAIATYRNTGLALLDSYISSNADSSTKTYIVKVNG